jgi:hypothetical protein
VTLDAIDVAPPNDERYSWQPRDLSGSLREHTPMERMNGTIKRLVRDKGFGFIAAGNAAEYFFHRRTVPKLDRRS